MKGSLTLTSTWPHRGPRLKDRDGGDNRILIPHKTSANSKDLKPPCSGLSPRIPHGMFRRNRREREQREHETSDSWTSLDDHPLQRSLG